MKKMSVTDTLSLSIPERIQLVEDIWDTITLEANSIELTKEDKKVIDERLDAYHKNPDMGSPWEDVFGKLTHGKRAPALIKKRIDSN